MPHGSVVVPAVHVAKCAPRDGRQDGRSGRVLYRQQIRAITQSL